MPSKNKLSIYRRIAYGVIIFSGLTLLFLFSSAFFFPGLSPIINKVAPLPVNIGGNSTTSSPPPDGIPVDYTDKKVISTENKEVPPVVVNKDYVLAETKEANTTLLYKKIGEKFQYIKVVASQNNLNQTLSEYANYYLAKDKQIPRFKQYTKSGNTYSIRAVTTTENNKKMIAYTFLAYGPSLQTVSISRDMDENEDQNALATEMVRESEEFIRSYPLELYSSTDMSSWTSKELEVQQKNESDYKNSSNK